jgi:cell cycle protein kinase DBF2
MASSIDEHNYKLHTQPPPLHTRTSEMEVPGTPTRQQGFLSPRETPQGSPSKSHAPPGAFDLPSVFDNAMKLVPTMGTPTKSKPDTPGSPSRLKIGNNVDHGAGDVTSLTPGSPTRRSNQENTPPGARPDTHKETGYLTHAAQSRQEPYRTRGAEGSQRYYPAPPRLSTEELEKTKKPAVKRLANVTQLCEYRGSISPALLIQLQTSLTTTSTFLPTSTRVRPASVSSRSRTRHRQRHPNPSTTKLLHHTWAASAPTSVSAVRV